MIILLVQSSLEPIQQFERFSDFVLRKAEQAAFMSNNNVDK